LNYLRKFDKIGERIMKNCFEEYLTNGCKKCEFWADGSDPERGIGCASPFPIMHCPDFAEQYEKDQKEKENNL
jgi:hypothetical protein